MQYLAWQQDTPSELGQASTDPRGFPIAEFLASRSGMFPTTREKKSCQQSAETPVITIQRTVPPPRYSISAAGTCQTIDHAVQNANAAKPPPQANNRALNLAID